ncbi:MAG: oligosaccharide flippase family protein [Saprospiraceae bacterium]
MSERNRSQGIKFSLVSYTGIVIGAISTLFIYPQNLSLYGFYGFLTNTASLFAPLVSLGFGSVMLRYFPLYRDNNGKTDGKFLYFIVCGYLLGISIFLILFYIFKKQILLLFNSNDLNLISNIEFVVPLTILFVFYELLSSFATSHKLIALPALLSNLIKIVLPLLFLFSIKQYLNYTGFVCCILFYYLLIIFLLYNYLRKFDRFSLIPNKEFFKGEKAKSMLRYASYSMLTSASAVIALRIDSIMITSHLGTEANGSFSMAYFISNAIWIPALAIYEILTSEVSKSSIINDESELQKLYSKSIRTMLIPTVWASICIYISFDSLVQFLPNSEKLLLIKSTLSLLLISRIVDAGTGVNHHLMSFSKFYRVELMLLIGLAIINIGLNLTFIPTFGITGAALSTLISVSIFNLLKTAILYWKLSYQPYDWRIFKILICGVLILLSKHLIPQTSLPLVNILINCSWASLCFLVFIVYFNISPEYLSEIKKMSAVRFSGHRR